MKNSLSRYESLLIFSSDYSPKQLRFLGYYYAKTLREWGASIKFMSVIVENEI